MKRRPGFDLVLLLVLCALGALLGRMQSQARDAGRLDVFSSVVTKMVNPLAGGVGRLMNSAGDFFGGIFHASALRQKVRALEAERAATNLYTEKLDSLNLEVDQLRRLLNLGKRPGLERLSADIIGYTPRDNRLILNVGSTQGVLPGLAVVCPEGIVGVVSTVSAGSCQVSLLGSANLMIGAMIARAAPSAGLLQGAGGNSLYMDLNDPKAEVKPGDQVLTSGYSDKIPRGVIVGRVLSVEDIPELGERRANIFPAVNVARVREVMILK